LAETIFYALSGGQESDVGKIADYPVLEAQKMGHEISYKLPATHTLQVGQRVKVVIDWDRRYKLMRLHFAAELILEIVYKNFPFIEKIGAHIGPNKARIDFLWDKNIAPHLPLILSQAQEIINANLEVVSAYSAEVTQRRYWKIDGFAQVSCGGTHIKRTGEIGPLELKRINPGKGKERIEVNLKKSSMKN
jgi:alanyl-tRNA synthetase